MRIAQIITLAGVAAIAFGYWGAYTHTGRKRFDEMAGIVPLLSLLAGVLAVIIGVVTLLYLRRPGRY
jgi:hypothetical protein